MCRETNVNLAFEVDKGLFRMDMLTGKNLSILGNCYSSSYLRLQRMVLLLVLAGLSLGQKAHAFNVIDFESLSKRAVEFQKKRYSEIRAYSILMDGEIHSRSTNSVSYDRSLVTVVDSSLSWPVSSKMFLRPHIAMNSNIQKVEGKQAPRTIMERRWSQFDAAMDLIFLADNSLDVFLGMTRRWIPAHRSKTQSVGINTQDEFQEATINFPHLGVVKRFGNFDGGFFFISGQEKSRIVSRTSDEHEFEFLFDEHLYQPTELSVFSRSRFFGVTGFFEFTAVQAGEGGNRTDDGNTVEEDHFRFLAIGRYPMPWGKGVEMLGSYQYKSLSYADNRNVTIATMPMMGFQLGLAVSEGPLPFEASLIFASGEDGQSLEEFNARYRLKGVGGLIKVSLGF